MDLDLTEDQEFFRETTRKFLESEMPVERVRELADHPDGFERDWWKGGAEMGWTSMLVPEENPLSHLALWRPPATHRTAAR